jgi:hypothetical protein
MVLLPVQEERDLNVAPGGDVAGDSSREPSLKKAGFCNAPLAGGLVTGAGVQRRWRQEKLERMGDRRAAPESALSQASPVG